MKGYIISPSWIFWVNTLDKFKAALAAFFIALFVVIIVNYASLVVEEGNCWTNEKLCESYKKTIHKSMVILIAVLLLLIFVPGKITVIEMQLARHATYENAEAVLKQIEDAAKYIVENTK